MQGLRTDLKIKDICTNVVKMSESCRIPPASETDTVALADYSCVEWDDDDDLPEITKMSNGCRISPASKTDVVIGGDVNHLDMEKVQQDQLTTTHHHYGVDLTGCYSDGVDGPIGVTSDFENKTALNTPSVGNRMFFVITSSSSLIGIRVTKRHKLSKSGPSTFIECTQLSGFKSACSGNVCVFLQKSSTTWTLGIIQHLFPLNSTSIIRIFNWIGPTSSYGVPAFATQTCQTFTNIENDFHLQFSFVRIR